MIKNSIGELKISPIKEEGKFIFFNDFITINGKVSKGDSVKIFVSKYDSQSEPIKIDMETPAKAQLVVRGENKEYDNLVGYSTLEKLYEHVSGLYREHFYFGDSK